MRTYRYEVTCSPEGEEHSRIALSERITMDEGTVRAGNARVAIGRAARDIKETRRRGWFHVSVIRIEDAPT